ncbi:hypothetical protein CYMTET_55051 [Cymbomonas tetramitiformis]|uniref:Uncharacterized protein n=1 Tax=Cymbomonas tetramitiformis TaxID=36881 RepID=A0AAE0BE03_9CHLO|nr:hypothetical protein CYMTET_55051 [Cymbomonas tetramitiformis]
MLRERRGVVRVTAHRSLAEVSQLGPGLPCCLVSTAAGLPCRLVSQAAQVCPCRVVSAAQVCLPAWCLAAQVCPCRLVSTAFGPGLPCRLVSRQPDLPPAVVSESALPAGVTAWPSSAPAGWCPGSAKVCPLPGVVPQLGPGLPLPGGVTAAQVCPCRLVSTAGPDLPLPVGVTAWPRAAPAECAAHKLGTRDVKARLHGCDAMVGANGEQVFWLLEPMACTNDSCTVHQEPLPKGSACPRDPSFWSLGRPDQMLIQQGNSDNVSVVGAANLDRMMNFSILLIDASGHKICVIDALVVTVELSPEEVDAGAQLGGFHARQFVAGSANFTDMTMSSTFDTPVSLIASTPFVDEQLDPLARPFQAILEGCREGQVYNADSVTCVTCDKGSIKFTNTSTSCLSCGVYSGMIECLGGSTYYIEQGYWIAPAATTCPADDAKCFLDLVYKCNREEACTSASNSTRVGRSMQDVTRVQLCGERYLDSVVLCGNCREEYIPRARGCYTCPNNGVVAWLQLILLLVALIVILAIMRVWYIYEINSYIVHKRKNSNLALVRPFNTTTIEPKVYSATVLQIAGYLQVISHIGLISGKYLDRSLFAEFVSSVSDMEFPLFTRMMCLMWSLEESTRDSYIWGFAYSAAIPCLLIAGGAYAYYMNMKHNPQGRHNRSLFGPSAGCSSNNTSWQSRLDDFRKHSVSEAEDEVDKDGKSRGAKKGGAGSGDDEMSPAKEALQETRASLLVDWASMKRAMMTRIRTLGRNSSAGSSAASSARSDWTSNKLTEKNLSRRSQARGAWGAPPRASRKSRTRDPVNGRR